MGHGPAPAVAEHVARALKTGRVALLPQHLVDRLVIAPGEARADGVVLIDQIDGSRHTVQADLVVLAASTIQTVSILLRSQREGLHEPSGRLGRRLMDHVSTSQFLRFRIPRRQPSHRSPVPAAFSFPLDVTWRGLTFRGGTASGEASVALIHPVGCVVDPMRSPAF